MRFTYPLKRDHVTIDYVETGLYWSRVEAFRSLKNIHDKDSPGHPSTDHLRQKN